MQIALLRSLPVDSDLASVQKRIHTARSKALGHDASLWTLQRQEVSESIEDDGSVVENIQQVRTLHTLTAESILSGERPPKSAVCCRYGAA
jgi:hypothetical protein